MENGELTRWFHLCEWIGQFICIGYPVGRIVCARIAAKWVWANNVRSYDAVCENSFVRYTDCQSRSFSILHFQFSIPQPQNFCSKHRQNCTAVL